PGGVGHLGDRDVRGVTGGRGSDEQPEPRGGDGEHERYPRGSPIDPHASHHVFRSTLTGHLIPTVAPTDRTVRRRPTPSGERTRRSAFGRIGRSGGNHGSRGPAIQRPRTGGRAGRKKEGGSDLRQRYITCIMGVPCGAPGQAGRRVRNRRSQPHWVTFHRASATIVREIFDSPYTRSRNVIGASPS